MPRSEPTEEAFIKAFADAPRRELRAGETLVSAGSPADQVFIILDGMLMLSRAGLDGRRQVLAFLFRDHFVGFTASSRYFFTAKAVTDTRIACCSRQALMTLLTRDPDAIRAFLEMTFRVLEDMLDFVFSLGQRSAEERLAVFFLYLRHRRKLSEGRRDSDAELAMVELPMSREDIADFLGLKKETVSRGFRALETRGLIRRVQNRAVRIEALDPLREMAGVVDFTSPTQYRLDR